MMNFMFSLTHMLKDIFNVKDFFFYLKNTVRLVLNFLHRLTNRGLNVPKLFCSFKQKKVLIFKNTDIRSLIANMQLFKVVILKPQIKMVNKTYKTQ